MTLCFGLLRILTQVLDLGVTRLLVQCLVEVFPKICDGDTPLLGTDAASHRICNERLQHLGRRSKACKTPPGYVLVKVVRGVVGMSILFAPSICKLWPMCGL